MNIYCETKQTYVLSAITAVLLAVGSTAMAEKLAVPIYEYGSIGDLPTCATGIVVGLKDDGDGFLAVRTGPGTQFNKIDEIKNGDLVTVYDARDGWFGVMYGGKSGDCSFTGAGAKRTVNYPGNKGWIHRNWLENFSG